jgi:hypothetical protein
MMTDAVVKCRCHWQPNCIGQRPVFDAILSDQQQKITKISSGRTPTRPFRPDDGRDGSPLLCRGQDVGTFVFVTKNRNISFTRIESFNLN